MLVCFPISVFAEGIQPRYGDSSSIIPSLDISSSGTATCTGTVRGKSGTVSITNCNVTLTDSQNNVKGSWKNLSSPGSTLSFSKTVSGLTKGETYTLSVTATINTSDSSETISNSTSATYY